MSDGIDWRPMDEIPLSGRLVRVKFRGDGYGNYQGWFSASRMALYDDWPPGVAPRYVWDSNVLLMWCYADADRYGKEEMQKGDDERHAELRNWWASVSGADAERTIPKLIEYGSADLELMGAAMRSIMPRGEELSESAGVELAIGFYLLGKVARLFGAAAEGWQPTDDTLFDITVYSMMLRRVREKGEWG